MFGAFKPSAPLSGGLLWKIPWRMSAPQKLRQRRRLRRVDNVVAVLDTALQRQAAISSHAPSEPSPSSSSRLANDHVAQQGLAGQASAEELSKTGQGQRLLDNASHQDQESRRHGRGPHRGEILPEHKPAGVTVPGRQLSGDEARRTGTTKLIERWKKEMPTEQEMLPRDKYSMFDRKVRGYRKGVHKLPKWTRVSQRLNPPGF